jgi:hypothetical protein
MYSLAHVHLLLNHVPIIVTALALLLLAVALLAATVVSAGLMAYTGLLGGQIRHTEIRPGFVAPPRDAGEEGEHE